MCSSATTNDTTARVEKERLYTRSQRIKKNDGIWGCEGHDSRVISTKAQIFDIFKPAVVHLWTQRYDCLRLRWREDMGPCMKSAAYLNSEPMFAQSANTWKPTAVRSWTTRAKGPPVSTRGKYHYLGWHKDIFLNGRAPCGEKEASWYYCMCSSALSHTRTHTRTHRNLIWCWECSNGAWTIPTPPCRCFIFSSAPRFHSFILLDFTWNGKESYCCL